jgi:hypothetical protein
MLGTSMDGLQARFLTGDSNAREEILRALEAAFQTGPVTKTNL